MSVLLNYTKPDRHYHNLKHIGLMIDGLEQHYADELTDDEFETLKTAILYHDAIYDASRQDNELRSAAAFIDECDAAADENTVRRIFRLILVTQYHSPGHWDYLGKILTDLDLAGLASHNYIRHSQQIRKEYAHATDREWYYGRLGFLTGFLSRETIFHTELGQARWEKQARVNMNLELSYIKAKIAALDKE